VKCCKAHKENCPALIKTDDPKNGNCGTVTNTGNTINNIDIDTVRIKDSKKGLDTASEYLPSDALTADPIQNAIRRRRMLDDSDNDSDDDSVDEHGWRISKDMMDRLDNSPWLRKELADGGLRQMIATVDNAYWEKKDEGNHKQKRARINQAHELSPREAALERAKHTNPKFKKFIDRLLLTAGVLIENGKVEDDIAALFNGDDLNLNHNITLASVPSKRKLKELKKEDDNLSRSSIEHESDSEVVTDSDSSDK
jgi:hypothetical protein